VENLGEAREERFLPGVRGLLAYARIILAISMRPTECYGRTRMAGSPVELKVGGQTYRVVASAEETELKRLADLVDARLRSMSTPGRPISPQALLLAAISLAHDLEEEKLKRVQLEARSKEMLKSVLARIDAAIEASDEKPDSDSDAEPSEPPPPVELLGDEFEL
jgi:cell division protein ZapA